VFRLTPVRSLIIALLFLAGAVGAVALAQFAAAPSGPLTCILYSACAVAFSILAMVLRLEAAAPPPRDPE
jgi:hypothetical protein